MSHRKHVYVSRKVNALSAPPPNVQVGLITVEIRAYWPDYMGHEDEAIWELTKAYQEARRQIEVIRNSNDG